MEDMCHGIPVGIDDACAYVRSNCAHMSIGMFDYLEAYYCIGSSDNVSSLLGRVGVMTGMLIWLILLFLTIGMAAYDYLCPNINTIAAQLGMAESLIGVTFLAFGNGAPDLFSTYAAFKSNSGSLAVGELIGAASFISAVVVGSMAITRPFNVSKRSFLRDCMYFVLALFFIIVVLVDGKIQPWECLVLLGLYALYVALAVGMQYYYTKKHRAHIRDIVARNMYAPEGYEQDFPIDLEATAAANGRDEVSAPLLVTPDFSQLEAQDYHVSDRDHDRDDQDIGPTVTLRPPLQRDSSANGSFIDVTGSDNASTCSVNQEALDQEMYAEVTRNMRMNKRHSHLLHHPGHQHRHSRQLSEASTHLQSPSVQLRNTPSPIMSMRPSLLSAVEFTDLVHQLNESRNKRPYSLIRGSPRLSLTRSHTSPPNDDSILDSTTSPFSKSHASLARRATEGTHSALFPPVASYKHDNSDDGLGLRPSHSAPPSESTTFTNEIEDTATANIDSSIADSPNAFKPVDSTAKNRQDTQLTIDVPAANASVNPSRSEFEFGVGDLYDSTSSSSLSLSSRYSNRFQQVFYTLIPSLAGLRSKTWISIITAVICAPSVLVMTLTVPVYESERVEQEVACPVSSQAADEAAPDHRSFGHEEQYDFDRDEMDKERSACEKNAEGPFWLNVTQAILTPITCVALLQYKVSVKDILFCIFLSGMWLAFLVGFALPAQKLQFVSFIGFFISVLWISNIATEVVAVLKALGFILQINEAILGLTVFAIGNSLGDLIGNVTIANMGFPTMALSACFGGPLLNTLVGIGFSCLVVLVQHEEANYHIEISRTLTVSGITLLLTLLFLLIAVPLNGWRITRLMGILMIGFWMTSTTLNVVTDIWLGTS